MTTIGSTTYNIGNNHSDTASTINYGGGGGNFGGNTAWNTIGTGAGLGGDDFSVYASTFIRFDTAGDYSIAAASDDGRLVQLVGKSIIATGGQIQSPPTGGDTFGYNAPTGHNNSIGVINVAAGEIVELRSFFWERGGGDSFELSIKAGNDTTFDGAFELLEFGAAGVAISTNEASLASGGATDTATVSITVSGNNDDPVANNDAATTDEDTNTTMNVLANDTDVDGDDNPSNFSLDSIDSVVVSGLTTGAALVTGSVTIVGNQLSFDLGSDFQELSADQSATITVGYTMSDDSGATSSATAELTVTGLNDAPDAVNDNDLVVSEDGPAGSSNVLTNDTDVDAGDTLSVSAVNGNAADVGVTVTLASGAEVTVNADGSYTYDPNGSFESLALGEMAFDSFDYTITDNAYDPTGDWSVREIDLSGGTDGQINSAAEAQDIIDAVDAELGGTGTGSILGGAYIVGENVGGTSNVVNYGGGGFGGQSAYPAGGGTDFVTTASGQVFLRAGTHTIQFGSDDGGELTITDANTSAAINFDSEAGTNGDAASGDNTITYNGTRGFGLTTGTFTLAQDTLVDVSSFFFERGGGDGYEIRLNGQLLRASESVALTDTATVTVKINGENDAPVAQDATVDIDENRDVNTFVHQVVASDVDATDVLSYAILGGNTNNAFKIDSVTGEITVNDKSAIDFETTPTFTLQVEVTDDSGAANDTDVAEITINLNDLQTTLAINDVSLVEGDSGVTTFTFDVTAFGDDINTGFSATYATADGSATAALGGVGSSDYSSAAATLNFSGAASQTLQIDVDALGDLVVEVDENFFVDLTGVDSNDVTITDNQGEGLIVNDDTAEITIADVTLDEGDSGQTTFTFTLSSTAQIDTAVSLNAASADDSAVEALGGVGSNDYDAASGTVTFSAGSTSESFSVQVNGDTVVELDQQFFVNLTGLAANDRAVTITDDQAVGMITNDDAAELSINDVTELEGDSGQTAFVFTVSSTAQVDTAITVNFETADGDATVADGDYDAASGTVTFAAGSTGETITVLVNGDLEIEPTESFFVDLFGLATTGRAVTIADDQGEGTITNDDFFTGKVFDDRDNDGVFDASDGDEGIEGITVELFEVGNSTAIASTTTDVNGDYDFDGVTLAAGSYEIVADQASGFLDGKETAGVNGGVVDNTQDSDVITNIQVGGTLAGAADTGYNFAELRPASAQGLVYEDFDNDGEVDFGELAIDGVSIALTGTDDRGDAVSLTQVTNNQGIYEFINLRPGEYMITETQPATLTVGTETVNLVDGVETLGEVDELPPDVVLGQDGIVDGNDKFSQIELVAGSAGLNYNFGERIDGGQLETGAGVTATIGFWQNKNGKKLIEGLNGDTDSTLLSQYLAETFPDMYGADAGGNDLTGKTNAEVYAFYKTLFKRNKKTSPDGPPKVDAQVMAVAMSTFVTKSSLSGIEFGNEGAGVQASLIGHIEGFGFNVTLGGSGSLKFDVLDVLSADEANDLGLTPDGDGNVFIIDILLATNELTNLGLLFDIDGNSTINSIEAALREAANRLYTAINETGDI